MNYNFKKIDKENKSIIKILEKGDRNSSKIDEEDEIEELILTKTSTGDFEISPDGSIVAKSTPSKTKESSNKPTTSSPDYEDQRVEEKIPSKRTINKEVNGKDRKFVKLASGSAKRKISKDKEKLLLDLTGVEELKKYSKCSLKISAIDGEGKETDDFLITDNYKNIKENGIELNLSFDKKEIEEVAIIGNKINLVLELAEDYNKNLKFIYEVVI